MGATIIKHTKQHRFFFLVEARWESNIKWQFLFEKCEVQEIFDTGMLLSIDLDKFRIQEEFSFETTVLNAVGK